VVAIIIFQFNNGTNSNLSKNTELFFFDVAHNTHNARRIISRFRMTSPNIPEDVTCVVKDIVKEMVLTVVATETPGAIDIVDEYDSTPLIDAVMLPSLSMAKFLLDKGASVHKGCEDEDECSLILPLHMAMDMNNLEMCKVLIRHGAVVNCLEDCSIVRRLLVRSLLENQRVPEEIVHQCEVAKVMQDLIGKVEQAAQDEAPVEESPTKRQRLNETNNETAVAPMTTMHGKFAGIKCEECEQPFANKKQVEKDYKRKCRDLYLFSQLATNAPAELQFDRSRSKDLRANNIGAKVLPGWKSQATKTDEILINASMQELRGERQVLPETWAEWKRMRNRSGALCHNCWHEKCDAA
jgi:hypothetical protein